MPKRSRLQVGIDVPWVTSWSEEALLGVSPCPVVGGRLAISQTEQPGFGRPQYSRNHMRRQRESVARMLCPMCGEPTAPGDRWSQTAHITAAGTLRARGLGGVAPADVPDERLLVNAGAIAPLHRTCAERSRDHCPHLQAHATPDLLPFPDQWFVAPLMVKATPTAPSHFLHPRLQALGAVAVISFLQLCGVTGDNDAAWRLVTG